MTLVHVLSGWVGLVILLVCAGLAVSADWVRQETSSAADPAAGARTRRWVRRLAVAALLFGVLGAGATLVRLFSKA